MARRSQRRLAGVAAASAAGHLAVLAMLALQHPHLLAPALPPPLFDVTVVPVYMVEPKVRARAREAPPPIRPRQARRTLEPLPIAPLFAPPATGPARVGSGEGVGVAVRPGPNPPGTQAELGRALKFGGVGCETADLVRLTPQERDRCAERLGAGAKTAAYLGQGLNRDKQALLDAVAAHKEAVRKYKEAPIPPGLATSDAAGGIPGLGDTGHGANTDHRF